MAEIHYCYPPTSTADGLIEETRLGVSLGAAFKEFREILMEEDGCASVFFSDHVNKSSLDEVFAAHYGLETLASHKTHRYEEIDGRTEDLILAGFSYGGKVISSSANAQSKWHAIFNMATIGQVTYPLIVSARDETQVSLADAAALYACYGTMVGTGKAHFDSGKVLKDAVLAAADAAAVDAIVDTR